MYRSKHKWLHKQSYKFNIYPNGNKKMFFTPNVFQCYTRDIF